MSKILIALHLLIATIALIRCDEKSHLDLLEPYVKNHGSSLRHRQIRECQPVKYGPNTHQLHPVHDEWTTKNDLVDVKYFTLDLSGRWVKGHLAIVKNALHLVSVLEPNQTGGCLQNSRATVQQTARQKNCIVAMNAGFFNISNGKCLGNVVSNGKKVKDSGFVQNAQFGILKNGSIFTGYLFENDSEVEIENFQQLVSGVIWLIRNNETYIDQSEKSECPDTQETGTFKQFVNVVSARTAVGHDAAGKIMLLQIDGKTGKEGVNLWELAIIMRHFGAVNAINTDGGGSATFVFNGTVINYPSDKCIDSDFNCERPVSTILCVHLPECTDSCNFHGNCRLGKCHCDSPWTGSSCSLLPCNSNNCSGNGECTVNGCECGWGWFGEQCEKRCEEFYWGPNCSIPCNCENRSLCNMTDGNCNCAYGFFGKFCEINITEILRQRSAENLSNDRILMFIAFFTTCMALMSSLYAITLTWKKCKPCHKCVQTSQKLPYQIVDDLSDFDS